MSAGNNFLGIEKIVKFCYTFIKWKILRKISKF